MQIVHYIQSILKPLR